MTSPGNVGPKTAPGRDRTLPQSPADYAMAIYRAATDDAAAAAERLILASRTAAVGRFEEMWPSVPDRPIPTRRVLRDWYLYVYQHQLDYGLDAPANSPIDGNRAEHVFTKVRESSGAPTDVVIDTVLALARDARVFARRVNVAQDALVTSALAGRVGAVFPRQPGAPVSARQAIGEQWYVRAFRAELDPTVFHLATRSLSPDEIARVVDDLSADVHSLSGPTGSPKLQESAADRGRQAALSWNTLPDHRRLRWLTDHDFRPRLLNRPWTKLPSQVQDQLLAETADLDRPAHRASEAPALLASAVEAAASRFGEVVIRPATPGEAAAARTLFHRGSVVFPPDLIGDQPAQTVIEALNRLKVATPGSAQTRGLSRHGWWSDKDALDQAVRMRVNGAKWTEIGQALGIAAKTARHGLELHGDLDPALTRTKPHRPWTPDEFATVAALRGKGRSWSDVAVLIGRSSGKAVIQAVRAAERREATPADDFPTPNQSVTEGPASPGL